MASAHVIKLEEVMGFKAVFTLAAATLPALLLCAAGALEWLVLLAEF